MTVKIRYEYRGTNEDKQKKKVYEYYYGYTSLEQVLGSGASSVSNVTVGD